jgi:hypothetical protein
MKHFSVSVEMWNGTQVFWCNTNTKDNKAKALVALLREQIADGSFIPHDGDPTQGTMGTLRFHVKSWDGNSTEDRVSGTSVQDAFRPVAQPESQATESDDIV